VAPLVRKLFEVAVYVILAALVVLHLSGPAKFLYEGF